MLKFLHFGNFPVFLRISGCCYGYGDQFCVVDFAEWTEYDWLLQLSDYRGPVTTNCLITFSAYNCTD